MLSLALCVDNDAPDLKHALPNLIGMATEDRPLLFIDQGARDSSREMIQSFIRRHGGGLMALDGPISGSEVTTLVRHQTGTDYVLAFTPQDRINHAGLATLERRLEEARRPELVVLAGGFWVTSADHPVPGPDAARDQTRAETLFADPRRLLLRAGGCDHPDPLRDPATAWALWEETLGTAERRLYLPDPVLLRPLPGTGAAPSFNAAAHWVMDAPKPDRTARLDTVLLRLNDVLALAPAEATEDTLEAALRLWAALPRALRRRATSQPGPAARLLAALSRRDRGTALAQLALLAEARNARHSRALAAEYAALRHDLDLALPGPEYLSALYTRLRGV